MLYKDLGLKKSRTYSLMKNTAPYIKSSIKLDSFLNFSKLSNDSKFSLNSDYKIKKEEKKGVQKSKNLSIPKSNKPSIKINKKYHKHLSCINDFNKSLNKNKTALSQYILLNTSPENDFNFQNIKLLGNSRYKYTSPMMFVEDQKNFLPDKNFGLIPIPMERCKIELSEKENNDKKKNLYELQRSIVMLRRKQFNKATEKKKHKNQFVDYSSNSYKNEADDISDYVNKIVFIQKWWSDYIRKKELKRKINEFKEKIKYFVNKMSFNEIKKSIITYHKPKHEYCFIEKIRLGHIYEQIINEKIIEDNDENNLESSAMNNDDFLNSKKGQNINLLNNEEDKDTYKNNYKIILNNYETDDNNDEKLKNLNNDENNLINNIQEKKNNYIYQEYNDEKFLLFFNIIRKTFLTRLINRLTIIKDLPIMSIFKPEGIFISKLRKRIYNKSINDCKPIKKIKINNGLYLSKIIIRQNNYNISEIHKTMRDKSELNEKNINPEENIIHNPRKKLCRYIKIIRRTNYIICINYIQKIYRDHLKRTGKKVYKKPLINPKVITIKRVNILKTKSKEENKKFQYFILLLNLFISKNIQEYIFQKLKSSKKEIISENEYYFPFYIKSLQRLINYLRCNNNSNQKVSTSFQKIFNIGKTSKNDILRLISLLSEENKKKLLNFNIFTEYEENDLINFLCHFSEFDKKVNNEIFIKERLKKIKLNDANIFSLIKILDTEYDNLVKGLYCFKCYNDMNLCNCKKEINNINSKFSSKNELNKVNDKSEDISNLDDFDFLSNDISEKRQINHFDYSKEEDDNNLLIKTKTNINDNKNEKLLDIILPEKNGEINDK